MKHLRKRILQSSFNAQEGHVPSALSILDIVWVLYDKILNIDAIKAKDTNRDRFVLSKGQASLGLYVVLAEKGFFPGEHVEQYCSQESYLGGHPDKNQVPGVEASTGSLGHGFPIAVGFALASKINKSPARIFCLIGDGECNEGTIWESAMLAHHHHLNNLCCIVDYNHSTDRALVVGDLAQKFRSFGWEAVTVNGHNQQQLEEVLRKHPIHSNRPFAIIAETIKGYGVPSMENNPAWHHRAPTADELKQLMNEIESYG